MDRLLKNLEEVADLYGEDKKTFKSEEFFKDLDDFCKDFQKAHKENLARKAKDAKDKEAQEKQSNKTSTSKQPVNSLANILNVSVTQQNNTNSPNNNAEQNPVLNRLNAQQQQQQGFLDGLQASLKDGSAFKRRTISASM